MTKKQMTFEEAFKRLEQIVEEFEAGEIDLDDMLKKYEESSQLLEFCMSRLSEAEKKIKILNKGKLTESDISEEL